MFLKKFQSIEEFTTTPTSIDYRVWPNEADLNNLNGSRYLTFMEVSRFDMMIRTGLLKYCYQNKMVAVVASQHIVYKRPITRWMKFTLKSRIMYWDEYFMYIQHKFEGNGKQLATAIVKVAWLTKGKQKVSIDQVFNNVGYHVQDLEEPEFLETWLAAEKQIVKAGLK